ncbi:lasso peptide isopeptide bond-forming cyclase [Metabacillus litoralis]|jgi:asparagine synthase (glutamine-hydrolysing)|uniref:lasso peptide isopeptide bond-forming cyclase n=1 Tax=Metabacillus litoralis TaxID=152268 RepID=UPI00203ECC8E|nr:lasso peptide isopeptide bond-forming cyclase [Metabacillus litoralis]MCM3650410.1 lasso peptide isopeptide bond-forming cyclase [Metabacillus litoralis]
MSAIAGIYHFNDEPIDVEQGRNVMKALQKFPADDVQIWHKENIFFGCHAQWITPESVGEQLPFFDYERQLAITVDAIIDNRNELFEKLQIEQTLRKNITDSELILLAYEKWGEEVPKYLLGDFAFMIWDEKKHQLFGARDFSGSRTLYFHKNEQKFAFCTVIRPLLSLKNFDKTLNEQWIAQFLAIPDMYDSVDTTLTVYERIEQLPPSHSITVVNGKVTLSRYLTIGSQEQLRLKSNQEYIEAFREVFQTSINARIRTHRQVGSQLSGGLDSGSVVSFASKALRKENKLLHTFSYVPTNDFVDWTPKYRIADERPYIQSTVQYVGNINDHYFDFKGKSPLSEVDDWLEIMEMPYKFFENSFWLKGIFEEAQKKGIGILLNGARGNFTISWGLALDYYALLLKRMQWIHLSRELQKYSKNVGVKKSKILSVISKKAFPILSRTKVSKFQLPTLINPEFAKRTEVFDRLSDHGIDIDGSLTSNVFDERKKHFEKVYPWNTTGTNGSKLSLNYSLWQRDPTNDLRVIQFCLSIPENQYVNNGLGRAFIRQSTENYLPDKVRLNQQVRGIQGADWVHRMAPSWSIFLEELQQMCDSSIVSEYINLQVIKDAITKVKEGPRSEYAFDPEVRILMRSLVFNRFIKTVL